MGYSALKKTIRIGGSILSVLLCAHLVVSYLYDGGKRMGEVGGSMSIAFVGDGPDGVLQPLEYGQDIHKDIILRFLFRSLIRTTGDGKGYLGDLARCDLGDLTAVQCTLQDGLTWSDGSKIRVEDVVRTIYAFKAQAPNDRMAKFLDSVTVSGSGQSLSIHASEKNTLMLDLLTFPIIRSDMIDLIQTNRLNSTNYITSGPYTFGSNERDVTYGFQRVTITRDPRNGKNTWIEKYSFKFFPTADQLEKNKDTLGLILPYPGITTLAMNTPRFQSINYHPYEYIGTFFNTDTLSTPLRQILSLSVAESFSGQHRDGYDPIRNIFFGSTPEWVEKPTATVSTLMREKGYRKRDEILQEISQIPTTFTGTLQYEDTAFFDAPSHKKIFFSVGDTESITLHGNLPSRVKSVSINGQPLQEYIPGNTEFVYKVARDRGNLHDGKNEYHLSLVNTDPSKNADEVMTIYVIKTEEEKQSIRDGLQSDYEKSLNTPEVLQKRLTEIQEKRTKAEALDPRFFYDLDQKRYTLKVATLSEPGIYSSLLPILREALLRVGIDVEEEVLDPKKFSTRISEGKKDYDILLIGFDAGSKRTTLASFFDSTRAAKDVNFSKIQDKTLDGLWYGYRFASDPAQVDAIEGQIVDLLRKDAPMVPVMSRVGTLLLDQNFQGVSFPPVFGDFRSLASFLSDAHIKEVFLMNFEGKGLGDFFSWISGK